jgi:hypothetical protein
MSTLSLSMCLSIYVSMYLSLAKEREKEWGYHKIVPIIESRTIITLIFMIYSTKISFTTHIFLTLTYQIN